MRFPVISTAWLELKRLPFAWWPSDLFHKASRRPHGMIRRTVLRTHPRCYLSFRRPYATMLEEIKQSISSRRLAVLVTHWWEFFRDLKPDLSFIAILHELAEYLAECEDIRVITFRDVAVGQVPVN